MPKLFPYKRDEKDEEEKVAKNQKNNFKWRRILFLLWNKEYYH